MSTRSTRRVTRANSRGTPSARHPSPPILDLHNVINRQVNTATPAARRARGESLPAIALRESTAYGGAGIAKPASMKPRARAPLQEVLQNILDDDEDDEEEEYEVAVQQRAHSVRPDVIVSNRGGNTTTGDPLGNILEGDEDDENDQDDQDEDVKDDRDDQDQNDQDQDDEDELQADDAAARVDRNTPNTNAGNSTAFGTPSVINGQAGIRTPAPPRSRPRPDPRDRRNRATPPRESGKTPPFQTPTASAFVDFWRGVENHVFEPLLRSFHTIASFVSNNWVLILGILATLAIATSCAFRVVGNSADVDSSSGGYHWYGLSDLRHNLGQFVPSRVANPLTGDAMDTIQNLLDRMRTAEYDIEYLKRQSTLGAKSISVLEKSLPDFIVSSKDKYGKVQIPKDFWNALKDKIQDEISWYSQPNSGETTKDISVHDIKRMAPKLWDEWVEKNAAKIRAWTAEDMEQAYDQHIKASFKNEVLVPKSELVKMLQENYKASRKDIHDEIKQLTTEIEGEVRKAKSDAQKSSMSKDEIHRIVADYLKKSLPKVQLEALAKANLNLNLKGSLNRINHFSLKTGAIIMPKLTAPNYDFGARRARWITRKLLSLVGRGLPRPNVPTEALTSWEEHGDCWCAPGPAPNSITSVPQIGIFTGNNFYPDEIIIEHIPQEATLTPGSTPREMEVFAYIEDGYSRRPLVKHAYDIMPGTGYHPLMEKGYVRIAKFIYDRNGPIQQAFSAQLRLRDFINEYGPEFAGGYPAEKLKPFTRKIVVRALSNHGEDFTCLYRVRVHGDIAEELDDDSEDGTFEQDEEV